MKRVFADTSYFIAVIVPNDALHVRAQAWADESPRLLTTSWVMAELAAYLAAPANRPLFGKVLAALRTSPLVEIVPATQDHFDRAVELYAARPDKAWSLVDCISFIVMQREGLTDALSADHHFTQAGFNAVLAEVGK